MRKFLRSIIYLKSRYHLILGYLLGILTIPLLQLAINDIGAWVLVVVPPTLAVLVILKGLQTIIQQTLLQYDQMQQRKQVMRDILSNHQQTVADAMALLTEQNWHLGADGFLRGLVAESVSWANLHLNGANLQGADLFRADLSNTWLEHANLRGADVSMATLQHVQLSYANMAVGKFLTSDFRGANLHGAICAGAKLAHSNLADAVLMGADLRGADLTRVNLQGARFLQYAKFDQHTILPVAKLISSDGKRSKIVNLRWHETFDWTPYQTGEAYRGYSDEWKTQMGWVDPATMPSIDEDVQSFLA